MNACHGGELLGLIATVHHLLLLLSVNNNIQPMLTGAVYIYTDPVKTTKQSIILLPWVTVFHRSIFPNTFQWGIPQKCFGTGKEQIWNTEAERWSHLPSKCSFGFESCYVGLGLGNIQSGINPWYEHLVSYLNIGKPFLLDNILGGAI